jgi:uncharacterized protein DUF3443
VRSFLVLTLVVSLGFLAGCGGNGTPAGVPITISLSPTSASVNANGVVNVVATVSNDSSGKGVSWTLSGVGALSAKTTTSVTYTAPATVTSTSVATVVATSVASSTVTASLAITVSPAGTVTNVVPIAVNLGVLPTTNPYTNGAFVSVQVCAPSNGACQTIDDVLLDTGSVGLRLLASQVTVPLVPLTDNSGNTLYNCIQFLDTSFLWGAVAPANIVLGGESANSTSVQLIADPSFTIPSGCSGTNEDTQARLGANGILGVGPEPFDCGLGCDPSAGGTPPALYYLCSSGGSCNTTFVSCGTLCQDANANQQVTNPVFNFPVDNNGVIVELPQVNDVAATVAGSLVFGIGTQSNNTLPSTATILNLDSSDSFITNFGGESLSASFIDSGSNGYFFPQINGSPAICTDAMQWYCPASTTQLSATNVGATGSPSNTVTFSVDNFDTVMTANPGDAAFSNLAGPQANGICTSPCTFDWGLPFFYNRSVFTAIDGTTVGTIAGPFFAY